MARLILIPGVFCDCVFWHDQITALSDRAEITVPDITRQSTISAMASEILKSLVGQFSLAGFSLGSQVALEIMSQAPERVERLALLSATHGGLTPALTRAITRAKAMVEEGNFNQYLEEVFPSYVAPSRISDRKLWQAFADMAHRVGAEAGVRQMKALLAITNSDANLGSISCPTLVIAGGEDGRTTPAVQRMLANEIHGSRLAIIENSGHFTPMERPERVNELLRDWLSCSASPPMEEIHSF